MRRFLLRTIPFLCLALMVAGEFALAQVNPPSAPSGSGNDELLTPVPPVPVVTGGISFNAQFEPGQQTMLPVIAPVFLVPIGKRGLIQAEFEAEAETVHHSDTGFDPVPVDKSLEYAEFDYFLNRFVTVVAGRVAEAFNIYKERLDARWIRNLQEPPLIFAFSDASGNGGELRGGIPISGAVDLNYAAYYSAATSGVIAGSERQAGFRTSLFLPGPRLEVGFSFNHKLQDIRASGFGTDLTWTMRRLPVDLRAEALISPDAGNGYWVEGAWRLSSSRFPQWLRRSQAVVRTEQYFTPRLPLDDTELPTVDTTRVFAGWNFYLTDAVRLSAAYGRQFAQDANHNLWDIGVNFRFVK